MAEHDSELTYTAIEELQPGEKMRRVFEQFQPAYERWFARGGDNRPSYAQCSRALRKHMPEILPVYERMCDLADANDATARFLSLYQPPAFMTGCSQVIWQGEPLAMIRNYDYAANLTEGINLHSAWTGPRVIAMNDCFWGALDGMNEHGLTIALAFGGRKVVGKGFAIPLIVRYLLETCRSSEDAVSALHRIPSHMAYNISVLDKTGAHATIFVAPDRPAKVTDALVCTNHQHRIEWPEHASMTATMEREAFLNTALGNANESYEKLKSRFLKPPLYREDGFKRWRTLYSAAYRPRDGACDYFWPGTSQQQSFDHFVECRLEPLHVA